MSARSDIETISKLLGGNRGASFVLARIIQVALEAAREDHIDSRVKELEDLVEILRQELKSPEPVDIGMEPSRRWPTLGAVPVGVNYVRSVGTKAIHRKTIDGWQVYMDGRWYRRGLGIHGPFVEDVRGAHMGQLTRSLASCRVDLVYETRDYTGTCIWYFESGSWWARRPGANPVQVHSASAYDSLAPFAVAGVA